MRAWPLHVVFATILVGSLAAKERAADMLVDVDDLDRETAVMHVARSHGLVFREDVTIAGTMFARWHLRLPAAPGRCWSFCA